MCRAVKAGLAWKLPKSRVSDLLTYCVSRLNLRRTSALQGVMSPSFLFTAMTPVYDRVFGLSFGDYVEMYDGTTNTSRQRSLACIALYPVGNAAGSWMFWNMATKRHVRRSNWIQMVTTDLVVDAVDATADQEEADAARPGAMEVDGNVPDPMLNKSVEDDVIVEGEMGDDNELETSDSLTEPEVLRRSKRIKSGVAPPERFTLVTKIGEAQWGKQEEKGRAVKSKLKQLFHEELNMLKPVKELLTGVVELGSHMFVSERRTATEEYDKVKARLVTDGSQQDARLYPNKSSPMLAMYSLYTVLAMYAGMNGYLMAKIDIKVGFRTGTECHQSRTSPKHQSSPPVQSITRTGRTGFFREMKK
jgi:hypothetical protein